VAGDDENTFLGLWLDSTVLWQSDQSILEFRLELSILICAHYRINFSRRTVIQCGVQRVRILHLFHCSMAIARRTAMTDAEQNQNHSVCKE